MSVTTTYDHRPGLPRVFESLTDHRRREMLATLVTEEGSLSVGTLASTLAEDDALATDDAKTVQAALRHVHLPKLATIDLVAWDRGTATVTLGDHPIVENPRFRSLLEAGDDRWAVATTVHSADARRSVVEVLAAETGETTREALAAEIASADTGSEAGPGADRLAVKLHHVHLPKLASVDLLAYDPADGTVVPEGDLDVPLLDGPVGAN